MKKYVLGISGSPRRGGNTEILLDRALEGAASGGAKTEKLILNEMRFAPCQECGGCRYTGICVVDDDMKLIYEGVTRADAVILSSPIFFGSISAQLKAMIDRFQCAWAAKYLLKRPKTRVGKRGAFIAAGGSGKDAFFENARSIIKIFFTTLDIKYAGELFVEKVEEKAEILNNKKALKRAYELGKTLT